MIQRLCGSDITCFEFLRGLHTLETLAVDGATDVSTLEPLAGLSRLTSLKLTNMQQPEAVDDGSADEDDSGCDSDEDDGCGEATVQPGMSLQPLAKLTALTTLSLRGCATVRDVSPLATLVHLRTLDLRDTSVVSVLCLHGITRLSIRSNLA